MSGHTINIPLTEEEYLELNMMYNAFTKINLKHPNKRDKSRPEFYKELIQEGIKQKKIKEKTKWQEAKELIR